MLRALIYIAVLWAAPSFAEPITLDQFTVTDADTIRLVGAEKGTRLVGFNAPETRSPKCDAEFALGRRAEARFGDLLASAGIIELEMVACACPPGTEGTMACNFARSCGFLSVDGRDVGEILIAEGLAVPFVCGKTSCPATPEPWCDGS